MEYIFQRILLFFILNKVANTNFNNNNNNIYIKNYSMETLKITFMQNH